MRMRRTSLTSATPRAFRWAETWCAPPTSRPPSFLVRAIKDPIDANLDRIQIVKGWLGAEGVSREKIFNVAWSGERALSSDGRLDAVGDTVDRRAATYTNDIGAPELSAVWTDPEFDPAVRAFYYARVIQIPTPRHSLVDGTTTTQPEFSFWFEDIGWNLENQGAIPDIEVDIAPHDYAAGRDPQLDRAISEALRLLEANPVTIPNLENKPSRAVPKLPPRAN